MKNGVASSASEATPFRLGRSDATAREFEATFDQSGRELRSELWLLILVWIALVVIFHEYLFDVPSALLSWIPLLLLGVAVPAVLRWLSGARSPWKRWSQGLFIIATYLDVTCLMVIRVAGLQHGESPLPIVVPVAVLMSLVVAQIRFVVLMPAILLGLVGIIIAELSAHHVTSASLFDLAASAGIVAVSLSAAYELQNSSRAAWLRQRELDRLSRFDSLTGLPNRRHFDEELRGCVADGEAVTLAIIDLDGFKAYNDRLGHPAGDECLRAIGAHLRAQTDLGHELVDRHAGEEFAVLWRGVSSDDARPRAELLRRSIGEMGIMMPDGQGVVTASAGTAELRLTPEESATLTPALRSGLARTLLDRADQALYRAKTAGRDRVIHDRDIVRCADAYPAEPFAGSGDEPAGPQLRETATSLRFTAPRDEATFLEQYEAQGRRIRRYVMIGLFLVCVFIFIFQDSLLKIPPEAAAFGRLTLAIGLMPAAAVAIVGATWSRLYRWSAPIYIGAVAVMLTAQMFERAVQTPKGFDVVPFLMPVSVLLSLCIVQITYNLLMPSTVALLGGVIVCESLTLPLNGYQVLAMSTAAVMVFVTLRFAYLLERSRRLDWGRSKQLEVLSRTDPLTRLPNRRAFLAHLRAELAAGRAPALLLLDVDRFKDFNDRFGHLAGDECLVAVGEQLRSRAAAHGGFAARLGGEEFAVVLPGGAGTRDLAESLRASAVGPGEVTASAGLAESSDAGAAADARVAAAELIASADAALYRAKRGGRDRLTVAGDHTAADG